MNVELPIKSSGDFGGKLPPPPDDPDRNRWDSEDPEPARQAFAILNHLVQEEFKKHAWFHGLGNASFPAARPDDKSGVLGIADQFVDESAKVERKRGLVIIVSDREPSELDEIKSRVQSLMESLKAEAIPFAVINRDTAKQEMEYLEAQEARDKDLATLGDAPELKEKILFIHPSRHPSGPFYIVVPDSMNQQQRDVVKKCVSGLVKRRFTVYAQSTWNSAVNGA